MSSDPQHRGAHDDAPLVVFVPGSLCDGALFEHQLGALAAAGYRVALADVTRSSSIEAMAEELLHDFAGDLAIVGLSMGAIVATEASAVAPERVRGLCLLDTNLAPPRTEQVDQRRSWRLQVADGGFGLLARDLVDVMSAAPDRHRAQIEAMAHRVGADAFLRQNEALLHRRDRRQDLDALRCPMLIGGGERDELCPPALHLGLATDHPTVTHRVFPHAGHLATIDQPEALSGALLEWLTKVHCPTAMQSNKQGRPEQ